MQEAPVTPPCRSRDARKIVSGPEEFSWLSTAHTNVLLEGDPSRVGGALATMLPHVAQPLTTWSGEGTLPNTQRGTLMILQVNRLDADQQAHLERWLERAAGTVRVIATTPGQLYSLVQSGAFRETLYYRLNVVRVALSA